MNPAHTRQSQPHSGLGLSSFSREYSFMLFPHQILARPPNHRPPNDTENGRFVFLRRIDLCIKPFKLFPHTCQILARPQIYLPPKDAAKRRRNTYRCAILRVSYYDTAISRLEKDGPPSRYHRGVFKSQVLSLSGPGAASELPPAERRGREAWGVARRR